MIKIRDSVVIERPIDEVFTYVTDPSCTPLWQSGLRRAWLLSDGTMGVGAQVMQKRQVYVNRIDSVATVTAWDPPYRYYAVDDEGGPFKIGGGATLEVHDGATRLSYEFDAEARSFLRAIEPLMGAMFARSARNDFRRLKNLLEAGAPVPAAATP